MFLLLEEVGGSLEDLWPFNEEIVARAIFESEIPIISAVGHETDFSISDFVADLRAPTPSAAAELAVPNINDVIKTIDTYNNRFKNSLNKKVQIMKLRFEKCMNRRAYTEPLQKINEKLMLIDLITKRNASRISNIINENKNKFTKIVTHIDTLSPLKTLARGYSITEKDGKIIRNSNELEKDDIINIKFSEGNAEAKIL